MSVTSEAPAIEMRSARTRLLRAVRSAAVGSLAGALSGIVWALLARGAMRLIARAMRRLPSFSLEGTLLIVMLGFILGTAIGIVYAGLRRLLPWGRAWKALAAGVALLATIGVLLALGPLLQEGNPQVAGLAAVLFGASLLVWGGLLEALYQPLDRRLLAGSHGRAMSIAGGIALALPTLLSAAALAAAQAGLLEE